MKYEGNRQVRKNVSQNQQQEGNEGNKRQQQKKERNKFISQRQTSEGLVKEVVGM